MNDTGDDVISLSDDSKEIKLLVQALREGPSLEAKRRFCELMVRTEIIPREPQQPEEEGPE